MAEQMKVLVFKRKHENGIDELRITPRRAWGICYGYILRDMHARKIDSIDWPGIPEYAGGCVQVYYNLEHGRQLTVDEDGIYLVYGSTWADISEHVGSVKLEKLMALARWYGPFNARTLAKFFATADEVEHPHVHVPEIVRNDITDRAIARIYGVDSWSVEDGYTIIPEGGK